MDKSYSTISIELIYCSLNNKNANEYLPGDVDLKALYGYVRKRSLCSCVCVSLEKTNAFAEADAETKKLWTEAKNKAKRKTILLDTEREAIAAEFEKRKIWYMPLKGVFLKKFYPKFAMREMSDVDILFDPEKSDEVERIFTERGYKRQLESDENQQVYKKAPVLNFEMHTALFEKSKYPHFDSYYADVKDRLVKSEGKEYSYHFSDEDFYIFILAHANKHYENSGTGLRTLVDIYLLNKKYSDIASSEYVKSELEKLGICDFQRISASLCNKIFEDNFELNGEEKEMLSLCIDAHTYGSADYKINKKLRALKGDNSDITKSARLKYLLRRAFPGREFCREEYPFFYRHPIFMPVFWVYRICRPKKNKNKLKNELKYVTKKSD